MSHIVRGCQLVPVSDGLSCFTRSGQTWLGIIRFGRYSIVATNPVGATADFVEFSEAVDWLKEQQW